MAFLPQAALFLLLCVALLFAAASLPRDEAGALESTLCGLLAILGGFALVVWLSGSLGIILSAHWLLLVALVPLMRRRRGALDMLRGLRRALGESGRLERVLIGYLALVCAVTFVLCLAPPSSDDYDSLMYHLAAPQQYIRAGRILQLPFDSHSYFPFSVEMIYLAALKTWPDDLLAGAVFARLFHWMMLPIACGLLVAMGQKHLSRRDGLLAAVLLASIPFVQGEASTAYIDVALTAIILAQFAAFWNWRQSRDLSWLTLSGAMGGFAIGSKYSGALFVVWLAVWLIGDLIARRKWQTRALMRFVLPVLLIGGGWYARNIWWTGNPLFPFAYELFGGRGWTAQMAHDYTADQHHFGFGRSPLDLVMLPWRVSVAPLNSILFVNGQVGLLPRPFWPFSDAALLATPGAPSGLFETAGLALQTVLGPLLLAFGAPLIARRDKPPLVGFLAWSFVFFALFWFATGQYLRYAMPALALLCLPGGWMAGRFLRRSLLLKAVTLSVLGAGMLFAFAFTLGGARARGPQSTLSAVSGATPMADWMPRAFSGYDAMNWANRNTPRDARFAVWGEARDFYLDRSYFWADDNHNNLLDYTRIRTPDDLSRALRSLGATHVLWNAAADFNGGGFGAPPLLQEALQSGNFELIYQSRGYLVCRLRPIRPD